MKKKTNPNRRPLTQADMKKAQFRWNSQLEQAKAEATSNATLFVQSVTMLALKNKFSFTGDDIEILLAEIESIANRIADPDTDYQLSDIQKELESINVFISEEWK